MFLFRGTCLNLKCIFIPPTYVNTRFRNIFAKFTYMRVLMGQKVLPISNSMRCVPLEANYTARLICNTAAESIINHIYWCWSCAIVFAQSPPEMKNLSHTYSIMSRTPPCNKNLLKRTLICTHALYMRWLMSRKWKGEALTKNADAISH